MRLFSNRSLRFGHLLCFLLSLTLSQQLLVGNAQAVPPIVLHQKTPKRAADGFEAAVKLANLNDSAINESSGVVASRSTPGLYWTHNDSGDGPFIYAFDVRGARRGVWRVAGASATDWEDIAAGPGPRRNVPYLYIGDIGDNEARRKEITVYRIQEPRITAADAASSKSKPRVTEAAETFRLRYPDGSHDAEALLVHPVTGAIYLITKVPFANAAIYEAAAPLSTSGSNTLKRIGDLSVPSLLGGIITGGDISPDGRRVALCDYLQGYEIVLGDQRADFNTIWKRPSKAFDLGQRRQGEAIGYRLDGRALLATSEGVPTPLIQVVRR
ncbi:MAG: hypothetical protein ABI967_06610 [bacterium]